MGKEVTVELKNDLAIRGTLHSVDQYLNIKLENTRVVDEVMYPHMVIENSSFIHIHLTLIMTGFLILLLKYVHCIFQLSIKNCFIRGSVVRYVQLPPDGVDVEILHDATRREARGE